VKKFESFSSMARLVPHSLSATEISPYARARGLLTTSSTSINEQSGLIGPSGNSQFLGEGQEEISEKRSTNVIGAPTILESCNDLSADERARASASFLASEISRDDAIAIIASMNSSFKLPVDRLGLPLEFIRDGGGSTIRVHFSNSPISCFAGPEFIEGGGISFTILNPGINRGDENSIVRAAKEQGLYTVNGNPALITLTDPDIDPVEGFLLTWVEEGQGYMLGAGSAHYTVEDVIRMAESLEAPN